MVRIDSVECPHFRHLHSNKAHSLAAMDHKVVPCVCVCVCVCVCPTVGITVFTRSSRLDLYGHTGVLGLGRSPL